MAERVSPSLHAGRKRAKAPVPWYLFFVLALLLVSPAPARVFIYNGTGDSSSIQNLLNTTENGDSLYLAGGNYSENLVINRSIVFGALDSENPPVIVSQDSSDAGITLAADGIFINGVIVSGNARCGLLVKSSNNQIRGVTVRDLACGIGMTSAASNIVSGNTLVNNSVGIDMDRSSRSNTFYLNSLNNTRDAELRSSDTMWSSGSQIYQYRVKEYTGRVGNFWQAYQGTDADGNGIGDTAYTIGSTGGTQGEGPGPDTGSGPVDQAPLISQPSSYTLVSVASPFNVSAGWTLQPPGLTGIRQQGNLPSPADQPLAGNPSPAASANLPSERNPVVPFLIQYWWLIPVALVVCVAAGIWLERRWRAGRPARESTGNGSAVQNITVVTKTLPAAGETGHDARLHYAARLPPALEKRYPGAEYVAEGGISRVFRAWDEKEGREIAVKIPIRYDEVTGSQFTKELHVWEGLHHQNIVEIYAANIFPVPYIEMEYVGSALSAVPFPLDTNKAVSILRGVAEGLCYAHGQGIVHRDIKPGNILITPEGIPKISDWGLSKAEGTRQSGLIGFSLEYAAPEQLAPNLFGEPGPWTDIYQLGVLFYEMLSGTVPFRGDGMGEVTHAILHDEPLPPSVAGPDAPRIHAILQRCMAKKPKDRYGSVSELLDELKKIGS